MKLRQYIMVCLLAAFLLPCGLAPLADAADWPFANPPPSYLLVVNGHTYRERNSHTRRAPASLTKVMTALIVLEELDLDEVVTVSRSAARETGSRIGLRRGDRLTVRDLLAATLINSANDACRALADHAAGNQQAFVARMNTRARRLELKDTRFTNASGHDHPGLYSSAYDLAILTDRAMSNPVFANLVARRTMRIMTVNGRRTFHLKNKNRLIGRYPGACGVKTGTTPRAGQCLIALAQRQDRKVLLVIMHARNRWHIAPAMLDAAFAVGSAATGENDSGSAMSPPDPFSLIPPSTSTSTSTKTASGTATSTATSTDSSTAKLKSTSEADASEKIAPTREIR